MVEVADQRLSAWGSLCCHSEQPDGKRVFEVTKEATQIQGTFSESEGVGQSACCEKSRIQFHIRKGMPNSGSSCVEVMSSSQGSECY